MAQGTQVKKRGEGTEGPQFKANMSARYGLDRVFSVVVTLAALVGIVVLAVLLVDVTRDGSSMLSANFLTSFPSQIFPENGGIYPALVGSLWLLGLTFLISVPLGLGAAVYLEEYAEDTRINRLIEINISNLAGVPSIIYGLLGLGIFVQLLAPITGGGSVLSGALTLSLLILPVIIVATREALRAIPRAIREGGYALGATKWEVIRSHLLPMALPGALTGMILALSRAIGEAAPLLVVGVALYQTYATSGPLDGYMALPTQIYDWISRPQQIFQDSAAAGIVVVMVVLLVANSVAILLRNRFQRSS
ncbi:MAG: Phosphate transport system permease protein PstA [uncultured Rubrobacteraceae bacterium]|uniref:Phosphate transport system permease protein PstA n=1 Tax=uncultured Rubrobacteraceae bacterium TaxID=349277 RepID=A0A6J4RXK9_9ACTN|nr:MAG: Phosphate transport system permease protein PstA [uncultured Rubrobacteraceae bacterium]